MKKRLKLYWLRAGKNLTSPSKSTLNQPLTRQASNNLWLQAWTKIKPPKIPEISVEKMSTHNTLKMPFLLPDKKHLWKQGSYILTLLLGTLWKQSTYTLPFLLGPLQWNLKAEYLWISVAVGGLVESRLPSNCSCCCEPLWKQSTCTLQFLLGGPLKAEYLLMICFLVHYMSG